MVLLLAKQIITLYHAVQKNIMKDQHALVSEGLKWRKEWPHIGSERPHLSGALAATCERGLGVGLNEQWLYGGVIALRLHHRDHCDDEPIKSLRQRLINLKAADNERLFWLQDALLQSLHEINDPWPRLAEITIHDRTIQLRPDRDLSWVKEALGDATRDMRERAMLLEAAIRLSPEHESWKKHIEGLRSLIVDEPLFVPRLDDCLKPSKHDKELRRWEKQEAERKSQEERRKAKNRASWALFWREVANQPENAFSKEQSWNTAWNLWRAMSHDGEDSRSSGWNRRFIEE